MSRLYCYCKYMKGDIYEIGVQDGVKFIEKHRYEPTIYVHSDFDNGLVDLYGNPVQPYIIPKKHYNNSIRKYVNENKNSFYAGDILTEYQYIREHYLDDIINVPEIPTVSFDLEVRSDNGFPDYRKPHQEILSIAFTDKHTNEKTVLGYKDIEKEHDFKYVRCQDENDLLVKMWQYMSKYVILTGWNCEFFDIPYMIRRCEVRNIPLDKLLPLGMYSKKTVKNNQVVDTYNIPGYVQYDYMQLFKKYNFDTQQSMKLNSIAMKYLDTGKIEYLGDHRDLNELYENDFDTFVDYNSRDTTLIIDLDNKFDYINLGASIAYLCKCNLDDIFGTIKPWDVLLYNKLLDRGIVPPRKIDNGEYQSFEGAYVKNPISGKHEWELVVDVASMYPNLIVSGRFSPYSIFNEKQNVYIDDLLNNKFTNTKYLQNNNVSMSACGVTFKNQEDPICTIVEDVYNDRVKYKNLADGTDDKKQKTIYKQRVQALKILLNSLYGAMGNRFFRYFNLQVARSITTTGQFLIKKVNKDVSSKFNDLLKTNKDYGIYSDTDSIFFSIDSFIKKYESDKNNKLTKKEKLDLCNHIYKKIIDPTIKESLQDLCTTLNFYKNNLDMEKEKIADVSIHVGKKNYIMRCVEYDGEERLNDPYFLYKGVKLIKSSTPAVFKEDIKFIVKKMFDYNEKEFKKLINEYITKYKEYNIIDLSIYTGVSGMKKYKPDEIVDKKPIWQKKPPIHVRASWVYNLAIKKYKLTDKYEQIKNGNKVKYIFLKEPNPFNSNVIGIAEGYDFPPEFKIDKYLDLETQIEKTFTNNFDLICKRLGWNIKDNNNVIEEFL